MSAAVDRFWEKMHPNMQLALQFALPRYNFMSVSQNSSPSPYGYTERLHAAGTAGAQHPIMLLHPGANKAEAPHPWGGEELTGILKILWVVGIPLFKVCPTSPPPPRVAAVFFFGVSD